MVWSVHDTARCTKINVRLQCTNISKTATCGNPLTPELLEITMFTAFLHSVCIFVTLYYQSHYQCDSVKFVENRVTGHHIYLCRNVSVLRSYQAVHPRLVGDYKHNLRTCSFAWICCGINKRLKNIAHLLVFTERMSSINRLDICFHSMCYIATSIFMFGDLTFCDRPF